MHMPKRNLFAYICATFLGVCLLVLAWRQHFDQWLGNVILALIGIMMIASGVVTILRHIKARRAGKED